MKITKKSCLWWLLRATFAFFFVQLIFSLLYILGVFKATSPQGRDMFSDNAPEYTFIYFTIIFIIFCYILIRSKYQWLKTTATILLLSLIGAIILPLYLDKNKTFDFTFEKEVIANLNAIGGEETYKYLPTFVLYIVDNVEQSDDENVPTMREYIESFYKEEGLEGIKKVSYQYIEDKGYTELIPHEQIVVNDYRTSSKNGSKQGIIFKADKDGEITYNVIICVDIITFVLMLSSLFCVVYLLFPIPAIKPLLTIALVATSSIYIFEALYPTFEAIISYIIMGGFEKAPLSSFFFIVKFSLTYGTLSIGSVLTCYIIARYLNNPLKTYRSIKGRFKKKELNIESAVTDKQE